MLLFDITNAKNALKTISAFTKVQPDDIDYFISCHIVTDGCIRDGTALTGENFINQFGISPDLQDVDELQICAVHYTSNDDENESVFRSGLRDLRYSLTADTPLQRFLAEYGIQFDVNTGTMFIGAKQYDIRYYPKNHNFDGPASEIARKVYYDNALSCFLYVEDVSQYLGQVHRRPEILFNIDQLSPNLKLSRKWIQRCKSYEMKFASSIKQFEDYSFRDDGGPLYEALLDKALCVAGDMTCGDIFAYMKPSSVITKGQIINVQAL